MLVSIIDFLANFVIQTINVIGYAGIFFLMLAESCGVPMPSEVIMPFSGFLVEAGRLNFWLVVVIGTLGNVAGSILAYYVGLLGGRPLIEKFGRYILISKHDLNLADKWFARFGEWAVLIGRLLPVVRTYISFPAGIAKMNFKKFVGFTLLGTLPWSILFTWLGVKAGKNWEMIRLQLHNFDLLIIILIIVVVVAYIWRHLKYRNS